MITIYKLQTPASTSDEALLKNNRKSNQGSSISQFSFVALFFFPSKVDKFNIKNTSVLIGCPIGDTDCNRFHLRDLCNCRVDKMTDQDHTSLKTSPKESKIKE